MSDSRFDAPAPLLPELIALNGRWGGSKPAVIFEEETLSWSEFSAQVCQVANGLRADGLQTGDRVAVLMGNSLEMIVTLFGIITAGGVAVPLNLMVGERGLIAMMHDAQARALFTSADQASRLEHPALAALFGAAGEGTPDHETARTRPRPQRLQRCYRAAGPATGDNTEDHTGDGAWTDFADWRKRWPGVPPTIALDDDHECNIIYSSGTTGQPKGIVHTHRRRLDWFYDLALALRIHRSSINLCSIGLFSNISWAAMGTALLTGGTLVIMRSFDASAWLRLVEQHRVTCSGMVPVQYQRILEARETLDTRLDSLETLMCCGSPLSKPLKQAIMEQLSPRLIELYGLTEGLITTLEPEDAAGRLSSVGKPLPGTDLLILNDMDQPCATGEAGEILGRGRIVMAGYHGRSEASEAARWTDEAGRSWLRTGDIGRLDEDGYLYLVDRKKDMIISGGLNLYPADIEAVIEAHPQVDEVAVIGIDSERWGESPFAVYVGDLDDTDALTAWTNKRVGRHQRIAGAARVDELPRNPNGKVLKRKLRAQWRGWLESASRINRSNKE